MTDLERLAKLEQQQEMLLEMVRENHNDLKELKESLTKWKGIAGGIAITVSCMWAAVAFIAELVKR
jgi:hypothetical protein